MNKATSNAKSSKSSLGALQADIYREMFDSVDVGVAVLEVIFDGSVALDCRLLDVNGAFERLTGLFNPVGQTLLNLLPGLEPEWLRRYAEVATSRRRLRFEHPARSLRAWYAVEAFPLGEPSLRRVGVMFRDVSEYRRIERELGESEARFSALADGLPMPVWALDSDGVMRFVNSAYGDFFGLDMSSGTVPALGDLLHPQDLPVFEFELATALERQSGLRALVRARRHDGRWRWIEMSATPRYSVDGRFIGLAGSSPDVTERREIELAREQLLESERAARNEAETMARLKDEFLATLSHELRTPLTTILGWSELLLQRVDVADPNHKGLSVIASSARAQKRLISDMLDLSGMLMGKIQLEVEVLDLGEQLREVIGAQEPIAVGKDHRLDLQLPQGSCLVLGDATRLQQVFWNLLSNAIKFTPAHGHIQVVVARDEGRLAVSIRDSGDGIAAEFLPHLFARFRQADGTATRRYGGLGLGLAIVQQLVELHGGDVAASSAGRGKGATFTVWLPEYIAGLDKRPRRELRRNAISGQVIENSALEGLRLLVVEDRQDLREDLCRQLQELGAEVLAVASATEALAALDVETPGRFHVLVADIGLQGMDGYGMIRTVRENLGLDGAELPAVAVTALAREDDRARALASGFQAHLAKPYSVAQLIAAVRGARGG